MFLLIMKNSKTNHDTRVKNKPVAAARSDLFNMSLDLSTDTTPAPNDTSQSQQVTMESISTMFDQKLNAAFSSCMTNLKNTIMNDIMSQISSEIRSLNDTLHSKMSSMEKDIEDLKSAVQFTSQSNTSRTDSLKEELCATQSHLHNLQKEIDDRQQRDRLLNIEIVGLPERKNEDLRGLLLDISQHINTTITSQDIDHIHRVQPRQKQVGRPRVIVCKLKSNIIKGNILAAFRKARGVNTEDIGIEGPPIKLYIREHLTSKNKALYKDARIACERKGYKYCWIKNCKILVRRNDTSPFLEVRTSEDLKKIN